MILIFIVFIFLFRLIVRDGTPSPSSAYILLVIVIILIIVIIIDVVMMMMMMIVVVVGDTLRTCRTHHGHASCGGRGYGTRSGGTSFFVFFEYMGHHPAIFFFFFWIIP